LLGKGVVEKIYKAKNYNPLGEYIKINRMDYQIIGVLAATGCVQKWNLDEDDKVVIPLNTAIYRSTGSKYPFCISARVENSTNMDEVSAAIAKRLLIRHRIPSLNKDAINVRNSEDIRKMEYSIMKVFNAFLISVAMIVLLVGGIGIMNIMFVSVSERTKEIGLRKAIGANAADILFQFIIEAVLICCVGGILGILLGTGASFMVDKFNLVSLINVGSDAGAKTHITPFSVVFAFSFSVLVGLIFGVLPARKASRLNPIDALRHD
jgi:macrolide transport system ATP-binding/permease protein